MKQINNNGKRFDYEGLREVLRWTLKLGGAELSYSQPT